LIPIAGVKGVDVLKIIAVSAWAAVAAYQAKQVPVIQKEVHRIELNQATHISAAGERWRQVKETLDRIEKKLD